MSDGRPRAIELLAAGDGELASSFGARRSLDPLGGKARTLAELGDRWIPMDHPSDLADAFARGLLQIATAFVCDFPENIFWDLDTIAIRLIAERKVETIRRHADRIEALSGTFGHRSAIRFRFLHDFIYGFDWSRWVARAPETNAAIGPFDPIFFDYLEQRQRELIELIELDDAKYGRLASPSAYRNPFAFSRDPEDERQLLETLSARDLIPVRAWDPRAEPRWQLPFADLREAIALEIGLAHRPSRTPA